MGYHKWKGVCYRQNVLCGSKVTEMSREQRTYLLMKQLVTLRHKLAH